MATQGNGGNVAVGADTFTGDSDVYRRFARQVAEQCRRLGVNPNELDKRGAELAERAANYVKSL